MRAKKQSLLDKKNYLKQLRSKMIFYWKTNRKQIKSANSFCLWTLNCTSIWRTYFFFKMDLFCFTGITLPLVLLFCLFITVTFLAPLRYVQLLQHLLAETCEGRLSWVLDCFTSILFGREARAVLRAIWPVFTVSSGNFLFHNRDCFELCTMCVFKFLVEFFNQWASYFAKSSLKFRRVRPTWTRQSHTHVLKCNRDT